MPRYVILLHEMPAGADRATHWDLMLEQGPALRTWALSAEVGAGPVAAEPLPDHRLAYLEYEGPVSGNRGHVTRWDAGEYRELEETPQRIVVALAGKRLTGQLTLERATADDHCWTVSFSAEPTRGSSSLDRS